jgi:hypothetical protein
MVSGRSAPADQAGHLDLPLVGAHPRDRVRCRCVGMLHRQLDVVYSGSGEPVEAVARQPDAAGDQVGVHAQLAGVGDQVGEIRAQDRLATGEVHLEDAELACLVEHGLPLRRGQFVANGVDLHRVGAVPAAQRAAVGQFGHHADRQ